MNIADIRLKCKAIAGRVPRDVLTLIILVGTASASFGLGYLGGLAGGKGAGLTLETPGMSATSSTGGVVASQNGTKYYFPNCAGVARLSDATKIWFTSAVAAHNAGYSLARNCVAP